LLTVPATEYLAAGLLTVLATEYLAAGLLTVPATEYLATGLLTVLATEYLAAGLLTVLAATDLDVALRGIAVNPLLTAIIVRAANAAADFFKKTNGLTFRFAFIIFA
jgi:hypothetical protein